MPGTLYLDTARLGQMSPSARNANLDFVRLTAEEPSSLYFEKFLRDGNDAWPLRYQRRYPGLNCWQGVTELKQAIVRAVAAPLDCRVLVANRSAQLMRFAARLLFRRCRHVLATDMSWPSYQLLLEAEASQAANTISTIPLRLLTLRERISTDQLVELVAAEYNTRNCDGLFLPAVDNLGVRLPVEQIAARVDRQNELRFVVVDGAQAFRHVPRCYCPRTCDLFIGGCHKWLRAYHPMGFAVYGRERSREFIDHTASTMIESFDVDDPLLRFTEQIESGRLDGYSETVSITPMFSCRGALRDALCSERTLLSSHQVRRENANLLTDATVDTDWHAVRPHADLQTGVILLQPKDARRCEVCVDRLREDFHHHGIVLTAYDDGLIRLSMPDRPLASIEVNQIRRALHGAKFSAGRSTDLRVACVA